MKPFLIAALLALASVATYAQSDVTLYGRIDVSVNYLKAASTPTAPSKQLTALASDASLLGFRGTEDLGGGLRAFFKLESGYQLDTGSQSSPTVFFNRESYVGLGDATFGSVELGQQWASAIFTSARTDPFTRFGDGSFIYILQGTRGFNVTYNNAVAYLTPNWGGFTGKFTAAPGEGANTGSSFNGSLEYFAGGPLYVGITYDQLKALAPTVGLVGNPVWSRTTAIGATYDLKFMKLHGWYQTNSIENLPNVNGYMVGVSVPVGQGNIRAAYSQRSEKNAGASLFGLGYDYFLSKRTLLYVVGAKLNNSGTSAFQMGPAIREEIAGGMPSPGQDMTGLQIGMRHSF